MKHLDHIEIVGEVLERRQVSIECRNENDRGVETVASELLDPDDPVGVRQQAVDDQQRRLFLFEQRSGNAPLGRVQHAKTERFERRSDTRAKLSVVVKQEDGRSHVLDSVASFAAPTKRPQRWAQDAR